MRAGPGGGDLAGRGQREVVTLVTLALNCAALQEIPKQAWALRASRLRSNFSNPGAYSHPARAPAHLVAVAPLPTPLPFILTLLSRRVEVASWTALAAMLKKPELATASRCFPC